MRKREKAAQKIKKKTKTKKKKPIEGKKWKTKKDMKRRYDNEI